MIGRLKSSVAVLGLSAALLMGSAAPLWAQTVPMPPIGTPKAIAIPQTDTYQLSNGIRVTLIPYAVVPKAVVYVGLPVGNNDDDDKIWLSDVTAALMREGAADLSAAQIAEAFADMGGGLGSGVDLERTNFRTSVLSERAPF